MNTRPNSTGVRCSDCGGTAYRDNDGTWRHNRINVCADRAMTIHYVDMIVNGKRMRNEAARG